MLPIGAGSISPLFRLEALDPTDLACVHWFRSIDLAVAAVAAANRSAFSQASREEYQDRPIAAFQSTTTLGLLLVAWRVATEVLISF